MCPRVSSSSMAVMTAGSHESCTHLLLLPTAAETSLRTSVVVVAVLLLVVGPKRMRPRGESSSTAPRRRDSGTGKRVPS